MNTVTQLLADHSDGQPNALGDLLQIVYDELRQVAASMLVKETPNQTLQATALVHEAYMRLLNADGKLTFENRRHFFKAASEAMRRILVENARRKNAAKRGNGKREELFENALACVQAPHEDILAVHESLDQLAGEEPDAAEVVKLLFFTGLSIAECAEIMGCTTRTVDRHWAFARVWLYSKLGAFKK